MLKTSFKKLGALALLATLGLTGCSKEIQAKPSDYDDKLLTFSDNSEIYHNMVSIIEDAYRKGSLASDVLDEVLYQYAVSIFGRYNKVALPYNLNDTTLKEVAKDIRKNTNGMGVTDESKLQASTKKFIDDYKAYHTTDNNGNRLTTAEAKQQEFDRVTAKWNTIEDRIAQTLYDDATSGSYSERGVFYERKLLLNYYNNLDKVANPYELASTDMHEVVITPDVEDVEVFDNYLNREFYQTKEAYDLDAADEDPATAKIRYVEEKVIPGIYRTLLIEQYLLDESYNTLGRSYARKINVISMGTNSNRPDAARYLMKFLVEDGISQGEDVTLDTFNSISSINVGIPSKIEEITGYDFDDPSTIAQMSLLGYEYVAESSAGAEDSYYKGTDYGDMMMQYRKITDDVLTTDTSAESDFTGSYTYSKEVGKEIKVNELANKDYTDNDWYVKNGASGNLPDEIKTRLFNIGVANALNNDKVVDRWNDDTATYAVPNDESNYVAKINGKYYLKVASKQAGADPKDDILFNVNNTFYVVQIEEAISASKLAKESTTYASEAKEEIINEVAKVIAKDESYKTLSTKHWLENCKLKYHDTVVYDYFKTNYPELFED